MHLFRESHGKNLVARWTGRYKDMDEGKESYVIPSATWGPTGKETAVAGSTIPSSFGRRTQYEVYEDANRNNRSKPIETIRKTCYGRLEFILECNTHDGDGSRLTLIPRRHLLAVITSCKTLDNADATRELVTYTEMGMGAVVGRFHIGGSRPRWAIVDRSGERAHTVFTDQTEELDGL